MSKYLSPKLETVTPYTPGEQPQDQQYIKLNTNQSPYLPSPAVVAAVSEHEVEKLRLYSDPACTDLLKTAAVHFGLQLDQWHYFKISLQKFISICAASARVAVPVGLRVPSPFPFIMPFAFAQASASAA